ncbi:MAG TPA: hypothetical protein VJK54_07040 [Chthoniobacterales bacterium]|nr:hypothetical protein [Chthoniobacterales bacterium]
MEDRSRNYAAVGLAKEAFSTARKLKTEDAWKKAGVAAKEAVTMYQNNAQGMNPREAIETAQQKDYWVEQANLADVKALAIPRAHDWRDWQSQNKANAIMKMTREKFGSPISPSMKAFMANPSETTLRATGKSAIIAMSAAEAEEALEGAEVFAKTSTDAVALPNKYNDSAAELINLSVSVTREVAEFARAVAAFKRAQETAATSVSAMK